MERRNPDIIRRSRSLQAGTAGAGAVVYWMSREQRVRDNWALLYAQQEALVRRRCLQVVFCLDPNYPGGNRRHFAFLLRGLAAVSEELDRRNIGFTLLFGAPPAVLPRYLAAMDSCLLVVDADPLRIKRQWKRTLCADLTIPIQEVDAHNVVPWWLASDKKEYGAYTLRPKLHRLLPEFLTEFPELEPHAHAPVERTEVDADALLPGIRDQSAAEISTIRPGEAAAREAMLSFIRTRLQRYDKQRNDPCRPAQSGLSPYLHFGQLAPQRLALEVMRGDADETNRAAFLEELVVRRELAENFCWFETAYDRFAGFPAWARETLNLHRRDKRPYRYRLESLEQAATHDPLWNACQIDMIESGRLHGYLRMYWAKKILEWSDSPEEAQEAAIHLNDRYLLDGRDPNGYAGIAWSIGGVHDRAWKERPIFGKIRYMNLAGCRRKFDVEGYIRAVRQPSLPE